MKMLFSRWNDTPHKTEDKSFQPFSWSSTHRLTTAKPLSQILPLHPVKDQKPCLERARSKQKLLHPIVARCSFLHHAALAVATQPLPRRPTMRGAHCGLVEVNGIEPMTSCLQSRRSPN
jgi:hypothetical protein